MDTEEPRKPNRLDDQILSLAGTMSPEEISREIKGVVSPGKIASRVQTLLKSRNWLSRAQERELIAYKLKSILLELEGRYATDDNMKIRITLIKEIGAQLDRAEKTTSQDLTTYSRNQGAILGRVVDIAFSSAKRALRDKVDSEEWDEVVREALFAAQLEISKHEIDDE